MATCARCRQAVDPVYGCVCGPTGRAPPCMADLSRIAARNPIVKAHLSAWEAGNYPSLESCLIGLAVYLAGQNEELQKHVYKAMAFGPSPIAEMVKMRAGMPMDAAAFIKAVWDGTNVVRTEVEAFADKPVVVEESSP